MKIKIILIFITIIMITGCSENTECNNGKITAKLYKKAYITHVYNGKILVPIYHREKYLIELNQNCTFEIEKNEFDKLNIGDEIRSEEVK